MGNSRVIRIPKELMERAKIKDDGDVDVEYEGGRLVIRPAFKAPSRRAARRMLDTGDGTRD